MSTRTYCLALAELRSRRRSAEHLRVQQRSTIRHRSRSAGRSTAAAATLRAAAVVVATGVATATTAATGERRFGTSRVAALRSVHRVLSAARCLHRRKTGLVQPQRQGAYRIINMYTGCE